MDDTQRINWLEKHGAGLQIPSNSCLWHCVLRGKYGIFEWSKYPPKHSLRDAIDNTAKIAEEE